MNTALLSQLSEIVSDLGSVIRKRGFSLWQRDSEVSPDEVNLSFSSEAPLPMLDSLRTESACTMCSRRISYKPGQFASESPRMPFLILVHNSFHQHKDRYLHDPDCNETFLKIIEGVLGKPADHFLVRDVLRCHFGKEDVRNPEWFRNCSTHIVEDITRYKIKGVLVMGEAARIIEPDREKLSERLGKITDEWGVPTVFTAGPTRLVYMRKNRFSDDKINEERRKIFSAVKLFSDQVVSKG